MQISSSTQKKNKVEDHSRIVKSSLNNSNCFVEPSGNANVKHSKLNTNSKLMCVKCNSSMFDARHELGFLEFVSDMNASSKSKSVKKTKKKEEWKPTGKVFTKIGYNWRPTRRTFTLVGNTCPLTRITATNKVPLWEPIPLEVVAQEYVVTKFIIDNPVVTMVDQRTMAELLRAPTEGYAEAIVVPPIPAEHLELKHSLINLVTSKQFFGFEKEDPHAHIRYFNKITSTFKYKDVPETSIKLMLFPFSIDGPARIWLDKDPSRSILTWDDLFEETFSEAWDRFKDLLRACSRHGFSELHQLDTFYNGLNLSDQDSLNSAAGGNLLERSAQDIASDVSSVVPSAMTVLFKQHQVTPAPASVKAVEESYVTCGAAHSYLHEDK
ncbi:hypothetical protein Tco_0584091 [Tanacetum coccineum]